MRILWEIFTLVAAIAAIFAIAKGFPQFGRLLMFFLLNPIGWVCIIGLVTLVVLMRRRAADRRRHAANGPSGRNPN